MKERDRRIAIFGDFGVIDRAVVEKIGKANEEQRFLLSEYITGVTINTTFDSGHPMHQQTNNAVPMLRTEDGRTEIIFNENHIFMRENVAQVDEYETFRDKAINILTSIIDIAKIKPKRLACSGAFTDMIETSANEMFKKIFAGGALSSIPSKEWELSVNEKKRNNELNCDTNNVLNIVRSKEVIGTEKNIPAGPIVIVYDYNTAPESLSSDQSFSARDIEPFISAAADFRRKVLEL